MNFILWFYILIKKKYRLSFTRFRRESHHKKCEKYTLSLSNPSCLWYCITGFSGIIPLGVGTIWPSYPSWFQCFMNQISLLSSVPYHQVVSMFLVHYDWVIPLAFGTLWLSYLSWSWNPITELSSGFNPYYQLISPYFSTILHSYSP